MIEHIRGLYFSSHHLARDLLANVAPFTAFAVLATIFFAPVQAVVADLFRDYLLAATVWTFILALVVYLAGGWFIGTVVAFGANFLQRSWSKLPWFGKKCSYTYWYDKNVADIDNLYAKLFPDYQYLSSGAAVEPTDKINALKEYLRKYNPEGYAEAYRQFMKVDVVRAAMFYSLCILVYEAYVFCSRGEYESQKVNWYLAFACFIIFLISITEMPRRIRKVVRTEYFFIIAAARLRDDLHLTHQAQGNLQNHV